MFKLTLKYLEVYLMLWPRRDIAHYDDEKLEHRFYFLESFWKAADMDNVKGCSCYYPFWVIANL